MTLLGIAVSLLLLGRARAVDFDYIIAGGGTTALAIANRLSADSLGLTVAVIEPGGDERGNTNVSDITKWVLNLDTPVSWQYQSVPQPALGGKTMKHAAGRGIGGSSLINGMTYLRADRAEIDVWKTLGSDGWSWDALLPHYKSTTAFTPPSTDQVKAAGTTFDATNYGTSGPLKVGFPWDLNNGSFYGLRKDTYANLGLPEVHDFNGGSVRGFGIPPFTVDVAANVREDSARAFYWPVSTRPNLTLIKGTVRRVIWADDKAEDGEFVAGSVEYLDANKAVTTINAKKEVIISAGAFRSSGILELSGVGNPSILGKLGIPSSINLPGVGENLHDQPLVRQFYNSNVSNLAGFATSAAFSTAQDLFGADTAAMTAAAKAGIPDWAAAASQRTGGAIPASAYQTIFGIQHDLMFNKNVTVSEYWGGAWGSTVGSTTWPLFPFSRGSVHVSSVDLSALDKPAIDPAFFQVDFDMKTLVAQCKFLWKFWHTDPMASIYPQATIPATYPASDAEWVSFILNETVPNSHPVGSASMMSRDLGGVVDGQFKVYGTRNVRVVDASVFPLQLSGHLTSTLYAVANRAADLILGIEETQC